MRKNPGHPDEEEQDDSNGDRMVDAVSEALTAIEPGTMVLKCIVLAEVIDSEGKRALWTIAGPDVKAWDTVGILQHALHLQAGQTMADASANAWGRNTDE